MKVLLHIDISVTWRRTSKAESNFDATAGNIMHSNVTRYVT